MSKIKCTLPNASTEISGVKFESVGGAMLSEDVSDDVALNFSSIPGYTVVAGEGEGGNASAKAPEAKQPEDGAMGNETNAQGETAKARPAKHGK